MRPRPSLPTAALAALLLVGSSQDPPADGPTSSPAPSPSRLSMSPAVACSRVDGFENYVALPEPRLTAEDKLKVYFRPLRYKVEPIKAKYRAKFTEDGRVRRKGEKSPLAKEEKLLEYESTFDAPDYQIYLVNNVGLKNLPPGDYEFDIILHDALDDGATATQTLPFTIIPTPKPDPAAKAEGPAGSEDPPGPAEKKASKKGKAARPAARPKG